MALSGARKLAMSGAVLALVGFAGCVTTNSSLTTSADRLQRNAEVLARDDSSDYSRDARDLAEGARDFRLAVNSPRADDRDVRDAFERLSHDYHNVRDGVDRSQSREAQRELQPVTDAYLDIERNIGGYPSDRYAGERQRDRY